MLNEKRIILASFSLRLQICRRMDSRLLSWLVLELDAWVFSINLQFLRALFSFQEASVRFDSNGEILESKNSYTINLRSQQEQLLTECITFYSLPNWDFRIVGFKENIFYITSIFLVMLLGYYLGWCWNQMHGSSLLISNSYEHYSHSRKRL